MEARATALYPFVPSGPCFATSLAFFAELGFVREWEGGGYAGLRFDSAYFILQDINVPEWQNNQMITFEVDDLDAYWDAIAAKRLPERFSSVRTRPPTDFAWGREVHLVDPGGVCWHVRQSSRKA